MAFSVFLEYNSSAVVSATSCSYTFYATFSMVLPEPREEQFDIDSGVLGMNAPQLLMPWSLAK